MRKSDSSGVSVPRSAPDWVDEKPIEVKPELNESQFQRLLAQSKMLRDNPILLISLAEVKGFLAAGDTMAATQVWDELEEYEQQALWLAPSYGGLFTTEQRKQLKFKGDNIEAS